MARRKPTEVETVETPELIPNVYENRFSDDDLERIREAGYDVIARQAETIDNSLPVIREKMQLVGVPFISLEWRFNEGKTGEFVSATIMREDGTLAILNDGSKGIARQYRDLTVKRGSQRGPIRHREGLSMSPYFYNAETGEVSKVRPNDGGDWREATTYYLT